MKTTTLLPAGLALAAALLPALPARTDNSFYVTIVGAKQGPFNVENTTQEHPGQIVGLKYDSSLTVPSSPTGQATGRSRHSPIVFEKEWGAATTQLYQAAVTNETLKTVTFDFYSTGAENQPTLLFHIQLTNAVVVGIHQHVGDTKADSTLDTRRYEDISLNYQKIAITTPSAAVLDNLSDQARVPAAPRPPAGLARPLRLTARPGR